MFFSIFALDEQLERKNERILYLERQLFGRRSEKRLPDNFQGQLSLFDSMPGSPALEEENGVLSSLTEEIRRKAEHRRARTKQKAITGKRSYQIPAHIERRETVIEPVDLELKTMLKTGQDVSERMSKACPLLQQMERWMIQVFTTTTPKSPLGKTISYTFGIWLRISRYCSDGRFQTDNNGVENAIRAIAPGRKNYLFSGNDSGAEDNCIFYTLLGSCLQAGVEPLSWLESTLRTIPTLQTPVD